MFDMLGSAVTTPDTSTPTTDEKAAAAAAIAKVRAIAAEQREYAAAAEKVREQERIAREQPREAAIAQYNAVIQQHRDPNFLPRLQAAINECVRVGALIPHPVDLPAELEQLAARAGAGRAVSLPSETLVRLARELRSLRMPLAIRQQ